MIYKNNVLLSNYTTMRIGGPAKYLAKVKSENDLVEAVKFAKQNNYKVLTLGHGSNIIFTDNGFDGLVIINEIKGFELNLKNLKITAKAGEIWDDLVKFSIENNFIGIEAMSIIPGTVGAAPVNNIGAYGQEVKDTVEYVKAYDLKHDKFIKLSNKDCMFSYRDSVFKSKEYGRYIISEVCFNFKPYIKSEYQIPQYPSLQAELSKYSDCPKPLDVRNEVIKIRNSKLPDPKILANTGSFFKNPIVTNDIAISLTSQYPQMPVYDFSNSSKKLSAGWLIDNAGLKGYEINGFSTYEKQALVIVNKSSSKYSDLMPLINYIKRTIRQKYNVELMPEPEIINQ